MFRFEMVIFFLYGLFPQCLGNYLTLTNTPTSWENQHRCADMWVCTKLENGYECQTDNLKRIDTTRLPNSFTAWLGVYIGRSVTIVYKGCYLISPIEVVNDHTYIDHITCARTCRINEYFGVSNKTCSCVYDTSLISPDHGVSEHACQNMKVYSIKLHHDLEEERCPVVYSSFATVILEKCNEKRPFFCYPHEDQIAPMSWNAASKNCSARSLRLASLVEVPKEGRNIYWLDGITYSDYEEEKKLPLFPTRCAALVAENGHFSIENLNCSSEHLSLKCHTQTDETGREDTGLPVQPSKTTTNQKIPTTPAVVSTPSSESSVVTSIHYTDPTKHPDATLLTTFNSTASTPNPEIIKIVVPCAVVGVLIILIVAVFCIYRKYRRSGYAETRTTEIQTRILESEPSTPGHRYGDSATPEVAV